MSTRIVRLTALIIASAAAFGAAEAACITPAPTSPAAIEAFKANPQALLSRFPDGGGALVTEIRNLVTSDGSVVSAIASLSKGGTPSQAGSIGTGLAQAAAICLPREPSTAQTIQSTALATDSSALILAFQAAAGDVRTTAVGGAGGGGGSLGGSGIGSTGGNGSGGGSFTRNSNSSAFANSAFTFSTAPGIAPTIRTRTSSTSVSP